ncbi:conserved hypothetical protein [Pirellula staleyi DSM 6068]|uniref:DUF4357 domain-containing protein n=1 Tax=Pirellula staleyi (strain ATCC 27377 / DSM 6068 / ICPB 4128) TaxID=530564 RepID=D2R8Y6_PIRSD|nr:GIY-YIG nuclease family protein [Pirellula staleyi]ADB15813.1 conserved hypothetical protein [Pirellula staleyi DSM 6068]
MPKFQQRPFSITIFVPDGDPDSLRLVEKSNWTGIGVVFNRTNYKQVVLQEEFERTGVYVLVGDSETSGLPTIYIGEGDPVKYRLNSHYSQKDFWDWAVFFVTKDSSLNKAHVQYLEARLIELARAAKQCKLANNQSPAAPSLSKAQTADVESFLADMLSIFPLVGLGVFEATESSPKAQQQMFYIASKGIKASGYEDPKGFVVLKGSQVMKTEAPSIGPYLKALRTDLLDGGVIALSGEYYVLTQDYVFTSPSTASSVVQGRRSNGRADWKTKDGVTLREIQESAAGLVENSGE